MAAALALWLAIGLRQIDRDSEFGVVDAFGSAVHVTSGWALAPPGVARLTRYPRDARELPLPQAEEARLLGADGLVYGFRGWVTVRPRPESWETLHEAADGRGLTGAVVDAVRAAGDGLDSGVHRSLGPASFRREFRDRLATALAERGMDLRGIELDDLDYLRASDTGGSGDPGTKLLVIGLDGADWTILDPLIEQGRMPNLAGLVERGARGRLLTISPMLSPVIWTTVATGVEPNRHGILDFLVQSPDGEDRQPVTSAQRKVPAVWELLGRSGIPVGVVGWWATWPADPVRGYLVADRLAYQLFDYRSDPDDAAGKTWPPELYGDIRSAIAPPDEVPFEAVLPYLEGDRTRPEEFDDFELRLLEDFRTLIASGETYLEVSSRLRERLEPRFEAVYLEGTDTIGHLFMRFRAPRLPGVDARRFETFREVVDRYYEEADRHIGRLLEGRGDDWTVMVLSDHGFASDSTRPHSLDSRIGHGAAASWHRRFGILLMAGKHVVPGGDFGEASVFDIAPTILGLFGQPVPRSWPGRVLSGAIEPTLLRDHPVRFLHEDPPRRTAEGAMVAANTDPASQELLAKLESLGYVSSGGDSGGDAVTFHNNAGVALLAEGRFEEAEAAFREGLASRPGQPMLLVNLGIALRARGDSAGAIEAFERVFASPNATEVAGLNLAQIALETGELARAETVLRSVLEREPDSAKALVLSGAVAERRGDLEGAARLFERAAEVDRYAAPPRNNLGNLARRRGDAVEAERWYRAAIEADPYFMGAYNNLALVYQDRGELDRAIDLYDRALRKAPSNAVVMNNLASLYYARGELEEAARLWQRCIGANPGYASPYNNLAGIAISKGDLAEAEPLLRKALDLDPGYGDARINLAIVYRGTSRVDLAAAELDRALEDPRAAVQAAYQYGLLELQRGDLTAGIARLERLRADAGDRPEWLNVLGEAYAVSGNVAGARAAWRRSLEIAPRQSAVRSKLAALDAGGG